MATKVIVVSSLRLLADGIVGSLREWGYAAFSSIPGTHWEIATRGVRMRQASLVVGAGSADVANVLLKAHGFASVILLDQSEVDYARCPFASLATIGMLDAKADTMELVKAIESTLRGEPYLSGCLDRRQIDSRPSGIDGLTPRETQVVDLLMRRLSYQSICSTLSLRPGTLKSHVRNIYRKRGGSTRDDLIGHYVARMR